MDTVKVVADAFFQNLTAFNGFIKITLVPELVHVSTNFVSSLDQEVNFSRGSCTLNIVPNSQTGEGSYYKIQIVRRQTVGAGHRDTAIFSGVAVVPDHDCNLSDIITVEPVQPEPIEAAKIYASEAKAAAVQSQTYAEQSGASSTSAENYENMANTASTNAMTYAGNAESAKVSAESARDAAILARVASEEAQVLAVSAKDRAVEAETDALAAQASAESARDAALAAQVGAETAQSGAETALAGVATAIATHNANTEAHADIRQEIANGGLWLKEEGSIVQMYPVPESVLYVQSHFEPYETPPAEGEKSPDNPSTIKGWREIECIRCGRNLGEVVHFSGAGFGPTTEDNGVYTKITVIPSRNDRFVFEFPLEYFKIGQTYTISYDLDFSGKTDTYVGVSEAHDDIAYFQWYGSNKFTFIAKAPPTKECKYLTVYVYTDTRDMPVGTVSTLSNLQIERASASTPYTPYEGDTYTIPLGDTYYGGYVDWARGVFVKEWEEVVLDGTEGWVAYVQSNVPASNGFSLHNLLLQSDDLARYACTHAGYYSLAHPVGYPPRLWVGAGNKSLYALNFGFYDANLADNGVANWKSYLAAQYAAGTPVKVVYKLATPVEHPITPQLITALAQAYRYMPKLNNVFSNTNLPTTVGYAKSPIQEHNDLTAAIIELGAL